VGERVGASALTHQFIFYFILLVYICSILHFNERPAATRSGSCGTRGYPDPYPVKPGPATTGPGFSGYGYGYVKKTRGRPVQCTSLQATSSVVHLLWMSREAYTAFTDATLLGQSQKTPYRIHIQCSRSLLCRCHGMQNCRAELFQQASETDQ
jgi:hypothetical protein